MDVVAERGPISVSGPAVATGRGHKRGRDELDLAEEQTTAPGEDPVASATAASKALSCGHSDYSATPFKDLGTPASGIDDVYSAFVSMSSTANAASAAARAGAASQARKARKIAAGATAGAAVVAVAPELEPVVGQMEASASAAVPVVVQQSSPSRYEGRSRTRARALLVLGAQGSARNSKLSSLFSVKGAKGGAGGSGGSGGSGSSRSPAGRRLRRTGSRASVMHHIFMCNTCERPKHGLWNPACRCFFSYLPHELLAAGIFSFLSRKDLLRSASAVCTRWAFAR